MLNIVHYPNPILRKVSEKVEVFDKDLRAFLSEMAKAMYRYDGIGLAAPQVGVNKRIIVVDVGKGLLKLVNPVILEVSGEEEVMEEGCLSIPGVYVKVKRKIGFIRFKTQDGTGKERIWTGKGLLARVIQHEVDHLDGVLMIDRAERPFSEEAEKKIKELEEKYEQNLSKSG